MSWEVIKLPKCKHGAALYDQTGNGDWFHDEECTPGCLPVPCDPGNFKLNSAIEEVDGWFFEWFSNGKSRTVAGPETCCKCGYGFEDIEDLFSPQDRVDSWRHVLCPGERS